MLVSLLLFLTGVSILVGSVAALLAWVRWLRGRVGAPPYVGRVAYTAIVVAVASVVVTPFGALVLHPFAQTATHATPTGSAPYEPSSRAEALGHAIAEAANVGAFGFAAFFGLTVAWLLYATTRHYWLAEGPSSPTTPPYR